MYEDLTPKQLRVYEFLKKEIHRLGYPPTVREIGFALGLSSPSSVHSHLNTLEAKGYIKRDPAKSRALEIVGLDSESKKQTVDVPILGQVTAGLPILAHENIEDTFPIPAELVGGYDIFMLNVKGESMINKNILDGDKVIVRAQTYARDGDIVVALIEDEATVKTFYKEKNRIRLQPENDNMDPIYAFEVQILGKVIGLYRNL